MSSDHPEAPRPLPDRPNLRHLKDQAKDLLEAGAAASVTDAQFKIARLYGFASWPKLKAHVDSLEEIGQLKQAIDANDFDRVKYSIGQACLPFCGDIETITPSSSSSRSSSSRIPVSIIR